MAIHSLNAAFEQEEKLALAHQLRNYISSCHHQDQLKSEKLSLWKNFIRILPSARQVFMALPVLLMVILPCLIAWPLTVAIILISPFILLPPCMSIAQKLNYWFAKREQTKNTKALTALIDASNQSEQPINPLLVTSNNKLFKENAPQKIPNFPTLSEDSLAEKLATISSESLCSRKILAVVSPKFVRITRLILSPDSSGVRHALAHSGLRAVATTMT